MFIPLSQTSRITTSNPSTDAAAQYAKRQVDLLGLDIERLLMITEALWTILKDKHGFVDEDLDRMVAEIDMRDGALDGRVAPSAPADCPECGAKLQKRRSTCLFCGTAILKDVFER